MGAALRLLLDTHAVLWWLDDTRFLSNGARAAIEDRANTVIVSPVSAFEIATKHNLGKLPQAVGIIDDFADQIAAEGFVVATLELPVALRAGRLPFVHRDPFDRLLIAQALEDGLVLVSNEALFDAYGVNRLW
jgi:PIN domain nuclease of toxin-antitoxin system